MRRLIGFVGIALLIHLASTPLLELILPEPEPYDARNIQTVTLIPRKALNKHKVKNRATPEVEKKKPDQKEEEEKVDLAKLEGQVVDVPPSPDDTPPEQADFLSEHNTRTERETASRNRQQNYQNAMNELSRARESEAASPSQQKESAALEISPQEIKPDEQHKESQPQKVTLELPDLRKRDRLALKMDPELGKIRNQRQTEQLKGNSKRLKLSLEKEGVEQPQLNQAQKQGPTIADLVPNVGVLAQLSGAPSNDFLENIEEGEGTFLNSREFKYASFFNRMKRGVSQHWRPLKEYRRRDPTGNVYGHRSRVTVLDVTLNPDGSLKEVQVQRSSGVEFLDKEAVAAFQRAEPFPNPPRGLVDDDSGQITFPFGFHIEFSRRGVFRLPY